MYEIYKAIIERFEEKRLVTYGEVARWLGKEQEAEFIDREFIEIDEWFKSNGQPPLTTVMVRASDGEIGKGYFTYHFGVNPKDSDLLWFEQLNKLDSKKAKDLIEIFCK